MPFTELEVQTWTLYTTVVIAIVGFFFNIVSLHRTKRAEEDMARPYVNVFVDLFEIKDRQRVYVIKNFGKTPAYITDITVIGNLGIYNQHNFKSLIGNMIAPGQNSLLILKMILKDHRKSRFHTEITIGKYTKILLHWIQI